jgi:hypothetical protein
MKILLFAFWLCIGAVPVFAANGQGQDNNNQGQNNNNQGQHGGGLRAAPAPLLGLGIPSALAVGGVLLGAKLWERKRRKL